MDSRLFEHSNPSDRLIAPLIAPLWRQSSPVSPPPTAPPIRLGIMASGSGSNFAAIAAAIQRGELSAQIDLLIYNNPTAAVADRAAQLGIPHKLINHRDFSQREALDAAIVAELQAAGVEWVIMAGWMRIVTPVLIDAFPERLLNIHPSLLPSFRGIRAVEQALTAGVKITGCTVHIVVAAVDAGRIIMQAAVPVFADDTAETLQARIHQQEHVIYPRAIALAIQGSDASCQRVSS
jgi:phosphoribosylglycinamide formyltransferase 1